MSYELIAITMFATMLLMLLTGQRVFAAIGAVAAGAALLLYGQGAIEMPFNQAFKLFNWFPLMTLPLFVYMGYMLSESGIADDLYRMFHVWFGNIKGGLAIGTIGLMVIISAMNGLSVAGMAIGASIALPELLRRGYDKIMVTGVIQAGSSLGILVPPSVVLVLYGMIAREPVGQLWLAGALPGLMMATLFVIYIYVRCRLQPHLGPTLPPEELDVSFSEKLRLLRAGIVPFLIFFFMTGLFVMGVTSLVESSAVGATAATLAALVQAAFDQDRHSSDGEARRWAFPACSCGSSWRHWLSAPSSTASARCVPSSRFFVTRWELSPWEVLIMMQLSYLVMGMFLDDTAMLVIVAPLYVPAGGGARLRSDLVRRALHDHLPDRLHDAALRLQSVPHARHGAA